MLKNVYSGLYGFSPRVEILALCKALNLGVASQKNIVYSDCLRKALHGSSMSFREVNQI